MDSSEFSKSFLKTLGFLTLKTNIFRVILKCFLEFVHFLSQEFHIIFKLYLASDGCRLGPLSKHRERILTSPKHFSTSPLMVKRALDFHKISVKFIFTMIFQMNFQDFLRVL